MNNLAELLEKRLKVRNLSVRDAAKEIGVSHSTVARAVKGETVEVDTLVKICGFLGIPVEDVVNDKGTGDTYTNIKSMISIEPELVNTLEKLAMKIKQKKIDPKILYDISVFVDYRMDYYANKRK